MKRLVPTSVFVVLPALLLGLGTLMGSPARASAQESDDQNAQNESRADESDDSGDDSEAETPEQRAAKLLANAKRLYHEGKWYAARKVYRKSFEKAPEDSKIRVHAALGRSMLLWEQGGYASARKWADRAMKLAERQNLDAVIGRLLLTLGHIQASRGQLDSAEGTLGKCVKLAAEQKDQTFGSLCKLNRRMVRKLQGESVSSEEAYRNALEKLESSDSPLTVGLSLAKTAQLYAKGGRSNRAYSLLNRAGKQYEKAGSVPAQARNRMLKARTLQNMGRWGKARKHLQGILDTFRGLGSRPAMVDTLGLLGTDAQHRQAYDDARSYYSRALEIARSIGNPQKTGKVRVALCELGAKTGSFDQSASHCRAAAETFRKRGMWQLVARAQSSLGRAAQTAGAYEDARTALLSAIETREEKIHPRLRTDGALGRDKGNLCQVEMRMDATGVLTRCRRALEALDTERHSHFAIGTTHYALGNVASKKKKPKLAAKHLGEAAESFRKTSPTKYRSVVDANMRQGVSLRRTGNDSEAAEAFRSALDTLSSADNDLHDLEIRVRTQYAQLLLDDRSAEKAAEQLEKLAAVSKKAGDTASRAWAYSALARAQHTMGDTEKALKSLEKALPLAEKAGDRDLVETIENNREAFDD